MASGEYVKGVQVQILKADTNGQATSHIERDPNGRLWHVEADKDPVQIREDEVSSLVTETSQKA
jgi:hypothetical protein